MLFGPNGYCGEVIDHRDGPVWAVRTRRSIQADADAPRAGWRGEVTGPDVWAPWWVVVCPD